MRVSFPHMGNVYVPLRTAFNELGVDTVVPPATSKRTLTLGTKYSPETLCLPFKITLGNMIEALDAGADTIVMASGLGLCRFGYYAKIQEQILRDLGYKFDMVTTTLFESKIIGIAKLLARLSGGAPMGKTTKALRFGLTKLAVMDDVERVVHKIRAIEIEKGSCTRIFRDSVKAIDAASDYDSLWRAKKEYISRLINLPCDTDARPLKVGISGEFYVVLEPFSNMDVEIELGKLGIEVKRSLYTSDWTRFSLFLNGLGFSEKNRVHKAAWPYLKRDVGGDGWETVGEKVLHSGEYDGIVHLSPFTCMPEIIAQNIMPTTKEHLPVLTIICDEQMGRAGMVTRLEAFSDLLKRRQATRRQMHSKALRN